jgi:hypothetical protein
MNCEALAEIILDTARGAAVPEEARVGVRRHMDTCSSCAAEYARQRDLTTGLQALAAAAQEWKAPAAIEQQLLAAFAAQHGQELAVAASASAKRRRYALATAAILALAVWGIREAVKREPDSPRISVLPGEASTPVAAERTAIATAAPATPPMATARTATERTATLRSAHPRPTSAKASVGKPATPVEFVRIPSAIGLPELESGTVLRMELPLTALPEYGLDIAPDAVRTSVEADILVGQDGQPRAIRLIGRPEAMAQDPRSRQ